MENDELQVVLKKCEWATSQIAQTVDKFVSITISFFVPILIALGLALRDPKHFQLLYFFIPWLMGGFMLIAAFILFSYQGYTIKNQYFERRLDTLANTQVFAFERYFNSHYFRPPTVHDPQTNTKYQSPLFPMLFMVAFVVLILDAFCVYMVAGMDFHAIGLTVDCTYVVALKWTNGLLTLFGGIIVPLFFLWNGKSRYETAARHILAAFDTQDQQENSLP